MVREDWADSADTYVISLSVNSVYTVQQVFFQI